MSKDEIREIAEIVGGDSTYRRFVKRINKEFQNADEKRNSNVYVLFIETSKGKRIGFSVIGKSPAKMRIWQKTFKEEGWVSGRFKMAKEAFELMYMYVKPIYRSKGYGEKLFQRTIDYGRKRKVKEVYAYVGDTNPESLDFYKRMKAEIISDLSDEEATAAFLRWKI